MPDARDQRRVAEYKQLQQARAVAQRRAELEENKADMTQATGKKARPVPKHKQGPTRRRPRGFGYRRD